MRVIDYLKGKIMPRPKGSKNKVAEQPKEFDYERDDSTIDGSYQTIAATITSAEARPARPPEVPSYDNYVTIPQPQPMVKSIPAYDVTPSLYLVEGDVQLQPRIAGRGSMVAKQTRIVRATSEIQAVEKYSAYFRGLSDHEAVYAVVRAAAMEVID